MVLFEDTASDNIRESLTALVLKTTLLKFFSILVENS